MKKMRRWLAKKMLPKGYIIVGDGESITVTLKGAEGKQVTLRGQISEIK